MLTETKQKSHLFPEMRDILLALDAVPEDKNSDYKMYLFNFFRVSLILIPVPLLGLLCSIYKSSEDRIIDEFINGIFHGIQLFCFCFVQIMGYKNFHWLYDYMEITNNFKFGKPPKFEESVYIINMLIFIAFHSMRGVIILLGIFQFVEKSYCGGFEKGGDERYFCGGMMPMWYPFQTNSQFFRFYVHMCQFVTAFTYYPVFVSFVVMIFGCVHLVCRRIQHLRRLLKAMNNCSFFRDEDILTCFKYYEEIVELIDVVNRLFGYILMTMCFVSPIMMAMLSYQIIMLKTYAPFMNLFPWIVAITLYCLVGQSLRNECDSLFEAAYDLPWHEMNLKQQNLWKMFLFRLRKPLQLKTRPFSTLDCELLLKLINHWYSFLMFLTNVETN